MMEGYEVLRRILGYESLRYTALNIRSSILPIILFGRREQFLVKNIGNKPGPCGFRKNLEQIEGAKDELDIFGCGGVFVERLRIYAGNQARTDQLEKRLGNSYSLIFELQRKRKR